MIDSYFDILQAFYNVLDANVTYGGNAVPVYTGLPKTTSGTASDYIYIGEVTQVDWEGADNFGTEETLTIQIVCRDRGDVVSKKKLADISSQVMGLLKPTVNTELTVDNFNMTGLHLDNSFNDYEVTDQDYAVRKIQRWRYFLSYSAPNLGIGAMRIGTTFIVG